MREWLLDYLRCPQTRTPLRLENAAWRGEHVVSGRLVSANGSQAYPIVSGIPRMLPGIRTEADLRRVYADSFGYQWNTFEWSRARDEHEYFAISDQTPESLAGTIVLDAGCGGGRVARVIGRHCHRLIGLDYSVAVERARQHTQDLDNCEFIQGDIHRVPLAPRCFDYVWSHGVLHHTPDTRAGFEQLTKLVADGGQLHVVLFLKAPWLLRAGDTALRALIRRLPYAWGARVCRWMGVLRHLPAASFWKRFVWFSLQPTEALRTCCNFDWYMPRYHHEHTVAEVKDWFRAAGFAALRYINGWPDAPREEKHAEPGFWRSIRLGQLLGVVGCKPASVPTILGTALTAEPIGVASVAAGEMP